MKRIATFLALMAVAALVTAPADAGMFKKPKKKAPEPEQSRQWRYDRLPTMAFHKGELRQDGVGNWKLGDVTLQLAPKCEISGPGGATNLSSGQTVIVMGPRAGSTIVAWRVNVQKVTRERAPRTADTEIRWSDSDPAVGVGRAPN